MARHNARSGARASGPTAQEAQQPRAMNEIPGGSAGVTSVDDVTPRFRPDRVEAQEGDRYRKAQRYMVTDGPRSDSGKIRYNDRISGVVLLLPGKEVTGATHDLAHMRAQGIRLEVIPDEIVEDNAVEAGSEAPPDGEEGVGSEAGEEESEEEEES